PCGLSFRQRLMTVGLDPGATGRPSGVDLDAVHDQFGEHAREQALEDTKGLGPATLQPDGSALIRHFRTGEEQVVPPGLVDQIYLGGDRAAREDGGRGIRYS